MGTTHALLADPPGAVAAEPIEVAFDAEDLRWFEQDVRPLLAEHCYDCHGPDAERLKGGLRLSHTASLHEGGETGPAIDRHDPRGSLLLKALRYEGGLEMPPSGKLPAHEVAVLTEWVERGAPMPAWTGGVDHEDETIDLAAGRNWWAYRPVLRPDPPTPLSSADIQAIDAFVAERLALADLTPAPRASDRELIRRATLDLTGLPPTYEQVEAYVADTRSDKWERLVDELLDSPRYGEHLGRMWLDVVRYAQSNGYEKDTEKPYAWRYRDYVVRAFNEDKPYDVFLQEQLAGDELDEVTPDALIATGFYRLGAWDSEPDDVEQARYDGFDDMLRAIGEGMMGVTVGCARCHDHRFDPIRQEDYFGLLAFVDNVRPYALTRYAFDSATLRPLQLNKQALANWETQRDQARDAIRVRKEELLLERWHELRQADRAPPEVVAALKASASERGDADSEDALFELLRSSDAVRKKLRASFDRHQERRMLGLEEDEKRLRSEFEGDLEWALTVKERSKPRGPTRLHIRGEAASPGELIEPGFLPALCPDDEAAEPPEFQPGRRSRGRRRALAEWIAAPQHPTTARVMVNRVWQGLFDKGLVITPDDFGAAGMPPSHPELLDWLAAEFIEAGWSLKHLHKVIMRSETYRRASVGVDARGEEVDPGNRLLWRQNLHRLKAEQIRDSVLAVSGDLNLEMGGRGAFAEIDREALAGNNRPGNGWGRSDREQRNRRSIYLFAKRGTRVPLLAVLDQADPVNIVGKRSNTTVPTQSLTLLNSDFMNAQARSLRMRLETDTGADPARQVQRLFEHVLARRPDARELEAAQQYLRHQASAFAALGDPLQLRTRLPDRLDMGYALELSGDDLFHGPAGDWVGLVGVWGNPYQGSLVPLPDLGPALLLEQPVLADVTLDGQLQLAAGCDHATFLLRMEPSGVHGLGLAVVFDAVAGELRLVERTLSDEAEPGADVLARVTADIEPDRAHAFRIELEGRHLRVELDGATLLETEVDHVQPGHIGLGQWGETLSVHDFLVHSPQLDAPLTLTHGTTATPAQRALESLCLALLNTNEFLTVD